jgi:hypothetical protein
MRGHGFNTKFVILIIFAILFGFFSTDVFAQDPQKRLMTKRAAKVDALRNLTEVVYGIRIDSTTKVENFVTKSDEIRAKVSATIQEAQEIDYRELADGAAEVTVEIPTDAVERILGRKMDYEYKTIRATGYGAPPGAVAAPKSEVPVEKKIVKVKGNGAEPSDPNMSSSEKMLMGKRAAKMDAYRNLTEEVYGVKIKSETTVKDFVTQSDEIKTKVSAFIQGARVVSEKKLSDGSHEVELELDVDPIRAICK